MGLGGALCRTEGVEKCVAQDDWIDDVFFFFFFSLLGISLGL